MRELMTHETLPATRLAGRKSCKCFTQAIMIPCNLNIIINAHYFWIRLSLHLSSEQLKKPEHYLGSSPHDVGKIMLMMKACRSYAPNCQLNTMSPKQYIVGESRHLLQSPKSEVCANGLISVRKIKYNTKLT